VSAPDRRGALHYESECVKWDEIAKLLVESKGSKETVTVDVESAAQGQLESAILLWFLEADIVSTHALAVAAWELIFNAGKRSKKPSENRTKIETDWSESMQHALKVHWDFSKHGPGRKYKKTSIPYRPSDTSAILVNAVQDFLNLFDKASPLMRLFATRATVEHPHFLSAGRTPGVFLHGIEVDDIAHLCRSEFMLECLVRCGPAGRAKKAQPAQD
jgi:hypothetical protein